MMMASHSEPCRLFLPSCPATSFCVPVAAVLVRTGHDCALYLLPWSTVTPPLELLNLIAWSREGLGREEEGGVRMTEICTFIC